MTSSTTSGINFHNLRGQIEVITGLLIGGSEGGLAVGGIDNTFIRDLHGFPYIPGSSLKGKIRSLLERSLGKLSQDGRPHSCQETGCVICRLFGAGQTRDQLPVRGPTRLLFRDAPFSEASMQEYRESIERGDRYYETKTETAMNRMTGAVQPGARFDLTITLRAMEGDDVQGMMGQVESGLRGLENDYLGGSGSRGYGHVKIHIDSWQQAEL